MYYNPRHDALNPVIFLWYCHASLRKQIALTGITLPEIHLPRTVIQLLKGRFRQLNTYIYALLNASNKNMNFTLDPQSAWFFVLQFQDFYCNRDLFFKLRSKLK